MRRTTKAKLIQKDKYSKQWRLYRRIAGFTGSLDRLPDAAEVRKLKIKTAPLELIEMLF